MQRRGSLVWLTHSLKLDVASVRYRAVLPAAQLEAVGFESIVTDNVDSVHTLLPRVAAVIIVKRLDASLLPLVARCSEEGIPVLLDLCDDLLAADYRDQAHDLFHMVFGAIRSRLSAIVTSSEVLRRRLIELGVPEDKVSAVPDALYDHETDGLVRSFLKISADRLAGYAVKKGRHGGVVKAAVGLLPTLASLKKVRRAVRSTIERRSQQKLAENVTGRTIIWFGHHGGPHSEYGMLSLLRVASALKATYQRTPYTLVVVSNHQRKWKLFIEPLGIPTLYVEWTMDGCMRLLAKASIFVMPAGEDSFSISKSANRALLAIASGTKVVAQQLDSLLPLSPFISVGDIEAALLKGLSEPLSQNAKETALHAAAALHAPQKIAAQWCRIIEGARSLPPVRANFAGKQLPEKLVVLINLVQDAPLALPVLDAAKRHGVATGLIVSEEAITGNASLLNALVEREIAPTLLEPGALSHRDFRWLRECTALFCPTDTNADSHQLAYKLVQLARSAGVRTYTIQHGLENVGLTANDSEFPDAAAQSDTIFSWLPPERLPDWVKSEVRARCVGVGRIGVGLFPRRIHSNPVIKPAIAVFENLHWRRYDDSFRKRFLERLVGMANSVSSHEVLLVPHPAGRWSLKNSLPSLPKNIRVVARPLSDGSSEALSRVVCVITTPSTVAVDAAEAGIPVAIAGDNLQGLEIYDPLPILHESADWVKFAKSSSDGAWMERLQLFLSNVRLPGDAVHRVVNHMFPAISIRP